MENSSVLSDKASFNNPSFTLTNRLQRLLWNFTYAIFFRPSPRPFHRWRAMILKAFGANLGKNCHIYPKVTIWAPWNLICADSVGIADGAIIYNPAPIYLESFVVISQEAYLCGASHDMDNPNFPLIAEPITVEAYGWICARATVQMGVTVGEGAVVGLGAIVTRSVAPWMVYAGVPARPVKARNREKFLATNTSKS